MLLRYLKSYICNSVAELRANYYRGVPNFKKGVTNSVTNLATIDNNSLENATIINRDPNPLIVKKHRIEEEYKHKKQNNYLIINA